MGALRLRSLDSVAPRPVTWLWQNRLVNGELNLLAGMEGLGKSTLMAHLAAKVTKGTLNGCLSGEPRPVLIVAGEDDQATTLRPRLEAAGADLSRVVAIEEKADGPGFVLPDDLDAFAAVIRAGVDGQPFGLVVIDPIKSVTNDLNPNRDAEVRPLLKPLARTAQEVGVTLLVSSHLNKGSTDGRPALWTVNGAGAWTQVPRSVLLFGEDVEGDKGARLIAHAKCNVGPEVDTLAATVSGKAWTTPSGDEITASVIHITGTSEATKDDVVSRQPRAPKRAAAREFLLAELATGRRHWEDEIVPAWKAEGRSVSTIKEARDELKKAGSIDKERASDGRWFWTRVAPDVHDLNNINNLKLDPEVEQVEVVGDVEAAHPGLRAA